MFYGLFLCPLYQIKSNNSKEKGTKSVTSTKILSLVTEFRAIPLLQRVSKKKLAFLRSKYLINYIKKGGIKWNIT